MSDAQEPVAANPVSLKLITPTDYVHALETTIPRAKKRVVVAAMIVLWGPKVSRIFEELQKAAERGVAVTVLLDVHTKLSWLHGIKDDLRGRLQKTWAALEQLKASGAHVYTYGTHGLNPFKGRMHAKISAVDDTFYTFGGVNFFDEALQNADYMLVGTNGDVVDCLEQLAHKIGTLKPPLIDVELPLDERSTLLFDGGVPGQSIIFERACELAKKATKFTYVSQWMPTGELGISIGRHANATVFANTPDIMIAPHRWGQAFDEQRYRIKNSYKRSTIIHAKFMLFELPDGTHVSLTGSNNFSWRGIQYGTQEIALCSSDERLYRALQSFTKAHIA